MLNATLVDRTPKIPKLFDQVAGCYNLGKTIGKGHFAVVKEAKHVFTDEKVAIKIIDKTKLDDEFKDQLLSEVMCMKLVQHPNIVRLYEVIDTPNKLYLVLELGDGGDLYDYISNNGVNGLDENDAKHYFRQILRAIAYCHKLHVVHRDLKPENVVFFKQSELLKLTDFGFSNTFTPGEALKTSCGSLAYSAPEILLGDSYDAPKVDIWSLGVILYMLVVGVLPFNETNDSETIAKIMDCDYSIPGHVSVPCADLIKKMLIRDSASRANLDEILNDEWLQVRCDSTEFELENFTIPLITQQHLDLEDHIELLTKMSDGNLATVEEIQQMLDSGTYNHISATYFLLAERKLKRNYVEEYCRLKARCRCEQLERENEDHRRCSATMSTKQMSIDGLRRISMILEGEESEEEEEFDAMTSLATVRRELENFVPKIDPDRPNLSGVAPPYPSRCGSRRNSTSDVLVYLADEYDSDTGSIIGVKRRRKRSMNIRSTNSISSQLSIGNITSYEKIDQLAQNYLSQIECIEGPKKVLTQIPEKMVLNNLIKSHSYIDIVEQNSSFCVTPLFKNNIHQFRKSSCSSQQYPICFNYSALRQMAFERRNRPVFDTGSNSTANCSSDDNSEFEDEASGGKLIGKMRAKPVILSAHKSSSTPDGVSNVSKRLSDELYRDICEPIHEEDEFSRSRNASSPPQDQTVQPPSSASLHPLRQQYHQEWQRSRSFDSRLRCFIYPQNQQHQQQTPPSNPTTPSRPSWDRSTISQHLAQSNFSLASFALRMQHPNPLQVIRGTFELQLHRHSTSSAALPKDILLPSRPKVTPQSRFSYQPHKSSISQAQPIRQRQSHSFSHPDPHTAITLARRHFNSDNRSISTSAGILLDPHSLPSNGEISQQKSTFHKSRSILLFRKDNLSCCSVT